MLFGLRLLSISCCQNPSFYSVQLTCVVIKVKYPDMSQERKEDDESQAQELPVEFNFIPESITSPFIDIFPGQNEGMVRGEPGGFVFSREYGRRANEIYQFKPRKDDAWVCTFSKSGIKLFSFRLETCIATSVQATFSYLELYVTSFIFLGTTWTQELVWLIVNGCDTEKAKQIPLQMRSPYLE